MSEAGYDGETCGGCEYLTTAHVIGEALCGVDDHENPKPIEGIFPCADFHPSLQCRQVRAEEEANRLRRERNELLERIATALGRATVHLEAIASEPDFRDGRCVQCNGTGTVNKGTTNECACHDCAGSGRVCE